MKQLFSRSFLVLAWTSVLVVFVGSGSAAAVDEFKGQTYEKALNNLQGGGWTVRIVSKIGEYLPTDECIVSGSRVASSADSSGRRTNGVMLLHLNCLDTTALNGRPGNSVLTPAGKEALVWREKGKNLSIDFARTDGKAPYCTTSDRAAEGCFNVCTEAGTCSAELAEYLGM